MGKKNKEKCKDEPEIVGQPHGGATSGRAEWRLKSQNPTVGNGKKSPHGGPRPNNPPLDHSPKTYKSGNPRSKKAGKRLGPARGGDKAVAVAARDAVSQQDGLKDALREQAEETRISQDANMHLRRDLTSVKDDLKQAEEKLGLHRNAVSQKHDDKQKNFLCEWQDETEKAKLMFILLTVIVPVVWTWALVYVGMFPIWCNWQGVTAFVLYQIIAILADRHYCAMRGYRSVFSKRITHSYSSMTNVDWDDLDRRADTMSLRELKHVDARYSVLAYRKTLNGVLLNRDTFGELTGRPDYFLISHELLAQLTVPTVMLADDILVVKSRLTMSVKTMHTVNIDKYLYKEGDDVAGNTVEVALGLWSQNKQRRVRCF